MATSVSIMWFRRDLRVADHPALAAARTAGDVLPLFVVDPMFATAGTPRRTFLESALHALSTDLQQLVGRPLVCRDGDPSTVVAALAAEVGARDVFVTADFNPYGRRRDDAVAAALATDGRTLHRVGSPYAVEPGIVNKADGSGYAVFSPFRRAWLRAGWDQPTDPIPPTSEWRQRWDEFVAERLDSYAADRNEPALDGTSRMSPALRFGLVHPRQLLADVGDDTFRSELAWREFYADVLFRRPESAWENLQPKMDALPVDTDAAAKRRFTAWCEGRTGFPIVDAGMRQLLALGWMHNRVRMIVGSFLVKDLHLPWQWGARHFMQHLVDGDLASNNHGWQWVAGTGTDPAPFFRIFNPTGQSERFDADGDYIRRWVPKLAGVDKGSIHTPGLFRPDDYPEPIVDHATQRREALARYNAAVPAPLGSLTAGGQMLDERKTAILRAIVQEYIATAQPVGSTHIANAPGVHVSSATVRNEMAVLEQEGYLVQPHTSAGRVPTDKGYRFFVDHITEPGKLDVASTQRVGQFFDATHGRLEEMLHQTSNLLAQLTHHASLVLGPPADRSVIRSIQLVGLSSRVAVAVAVFSDGSVENETIELADDTSDVRLAAASAHLQRVLVGHGLDSGDAVQLPTSGDAEVDELCAASYRVIVGARTQEPVFVGGTSSVAQSFDAVDTVRAVLQTLEQQYVMVSLVRDVLARGLSVAIGAEHGVEPLAACSVIVAPVVVDGQHLGTVGVLGPTRMNYPQAMATVEVVSDRLGRHLGEGSG